MFDGNDTSSPPRKSCPHHATITFKIDIRTMNPDGTLSNDIVGDEILKKYGISTKAQLCLSGSDESSCIINVKKQLEKLNG